ncbi:DUF983 domain-containing protein [Sphingomonas solaris]|uniref:DUF983 domain-containing protein n=1 Tax=Alterirhizorhabdus solaris TaxID=2529389 RepID=A0A558QXT0_9SPHN|nr:DUF983 domain-containing protein [Sphingomonas solaris]TVV71872.1 DUF983 domain-containing protein [Sphingomonas solaris]
MQTEIVRPLRPALLRGFAGRCPKCGDARLFGRFLKPVASCPACGEDWSRHSADDFPAYIVIILLGHLLLPVVVEVNNLFSPGMVAQMILWPLCAGLLALAMIQPVKGAVIAFQWARRMHGFAPVRT